MRDGLVGWTSSIGWSNRIGWYEGFHLLVSIARDGMISGFGFGSASTHGRRLLETFLAARAQPTDHLVSVGAKAQGVYIADKGFAGEEPHAVWRARFGAEVITPPHKAVASPGPKSGVAGRLTSVKWSKRCILNCSIPSGWHVSVRIH